MAGTYKTIVENDKKFQEARKNAKSIPDYEAEAAAKKAEKAYTEAGGPLVKKMAKGGVTRADGCAQRGKTRGKMV